MNKVIIIGRMTKDPEVRYGSNNNAVARFTLAVDRRFKAEGQPDADFINCVAFGKTAEHIEKYWSKGMKAVCEGRIQTGSYEKDGKKVYTTDVVVENIEFAESKKAASDNTPAQESTDDFMSFADTDGTLPFM